MQECFFWSIVTLADGMVRLYSEYESKDLAYVGGTTTKNHVRYFVDLDCGERRRIRYSVTYKHRKVGPELNPEKKREPIR